MLSLLLGGFEARRCMSWDIRIYIRYPKSDIRLYVCMCYTQHRERTELCSVGWPAGGARSAERGSAAPRRERPAPGATCIARVPRHI